MFFSFSIWDWQSNAKLTYHPSRGNKNSRVTALEFVNPHDIALLLSGSDDGSIRIWKNYHSGMGREPVLLTAWQALADLQNHSSWGVGNGKENYTIHRKGLFIR